MKKKSMIHTTRWIFKLDAEYLISLFIMQEIKVVVSHPFQWLKLHQ